MTHGDNGLVVDRCERRIVGHIRTRGHHPHLLGGGIYGENGSHAKIGGKEIERFPVGIPCNGIGGIIPVFGKVGFRAGGHVHHEDAVLVAFIAVMFHREPCQPAAVGRETGICVIAHHPFGEIACGGRCKVVEIEVAVGGYGIFHAGLLARHVHQRTAVGAPCERFDAAQWFHWRFVRLAVHDVDNVFDAVAGEIGDEGVGNFGDPFIPMLVHEVVDDAGIGLGEVGIHPARCGHILRWR